MLIDRLNGRHRSAGEPGHLRLRGPGRAWSPARAAGIGRASALAFARAGASVVVADVDEAGGAATVELARAAGGDARFVAHRRGVERRRCSRWSTRPSPRTAGSTTRTTTPASPPRSTTSPTSRRRSGTASQGVMLRGVYLCMKYELPHLLATRRRDREHRVGRRPGRVPGAVAVRVVEARRARAHEVGGARVRPPRGAGQRGVPRHRAHAHGRGGDRSCRASRSNWSRCTRSAASARPTRSPTRCSGSAPTTPRSCSGMRSRSTAATSFPDPLRAPGAAGLG